MATTKEAIENFKKHSRWIYRVIFFTQSFFIWYMTKSIVIWLFLTFLGFVAVTFAVLSGFKRGQDEG